jgi:parallel beta-helix repeat protein
VKKLPKLRPSTALVFETLDQRLMYSADLAGVVAAVQTPGQESSAQVRYLLETEATQAAQFDHTELVLIDARVENAGSMDLKAGQQSIVVDASETLFEALARWNASQTRPVTIDTLHLVGHGQDGSMQLGRETLDSDALRANAQAWQTLGQQLHADADILLYACDFAASARGEATVQLLAELTQADIAASRNITGASALGADWTLEYQTGAIDAATLYSGAQGAQHGRLTSLTLDVVGTTSAADAEELTPIGRGDQLATNGTVSVAIWIETTTNNTLLARMADANGVQSARIVIDSSSKVMSNIAVAMGADGRFAVTWVEEQNANKSTVFIQRFNANGTTAGSREQIDDGGNRLREGTTIAIDGNNKVAIAWISSGEGETTMANSTVTLVSEAWNTGSFATQTASAGQTNVSSVVMQAGQANDFVLAWVNNTDGAIYTSTFAQTGAISAPTVALAARTDHTYKELSLAISANGTSALAYTDFREAGGLNWNEVRINFFGTTDLTGPSLEKTYNAAFTSYVDPTIAANDQGAYTAVFSRFSQGFTAVYNEPLNLHAVSNIVAAAGPGLAPTLIAGGGILRLEPPSSPWFTVARNASAQFVGTELYVVFDGVGNANLLNVDSILRFRLTPPALVVSALSSPTTTEDGGTSTFSVALNGQPTGNVTVTIASSNTAEGLVSSPTTLTFNSTNWNVPRTVTITGGPRDGIIDGTQSYQITLLANDTESDPLFSYNNLGQTLFLANQNNDTVNTFTVTSTSDALHVSPGATALDFLNYARSNPSNITLRDAITAANNSANGSGGADQIRFASTLKDQTISLLSALPALTDTVSISALISNLSTPEVTLTQDSLLPNGSAQFSGLTFSAGSQGSQVQGLAFAGFKGSSAAALTLSADNLTISNNWFGVSSTGAANDNSSNAILATGSAFDPISGLSITNNRIVSSQHAILVQSASAANISGNQIGSANLAETALSNRADGVRIVDSIDTVINNNTIVQNLGSGVAIVSSINTHINNNVISRNGGNGVSIQSSNSTRIEQNRIGTDVSGNLAMGNGTMNNTLANGIFASDSNAVLVLNNVIASNTSDGVRLHNVAASEVGSNRIGLSFDDSTALGNALTGIFVTGTSTDLQIVSNTVSSNGASGIYLEGAVSAVLHNNTIGLNQAQTVAMGNGTALPSNGAGITVAGSSNGNQIYSNTIASNNNGGIRISGVSTQNNHVYRNAIGSNQSGSQIFMNGAEGISLYDGTSGNIIGGTSAADGNSIHATQGMRLFSGTAGSLIANNAVLNNSVYGATSRTFSIMTADWNSAEQTAATVNDALDADTGNNGASNTPLLAYLQNTGGEIYQFGLSLQGMPNTTYTIEFIRATTVSETVFTAASPISTLTVTTDASGNLNSTSTITIPGSLASNQRLVATATRMSGTTPLETSAYSAPANQSVIIPSQNTSVSELNALHQVISGVDPEAGVFTWSIASQTVPGLFVLENTSPGVTELQFAASAPFLGIAPDFESPSAPAGNIYSVVVVATDSLGQTSSRQIDISVLNVVEPPVALNTLGPISIAENSVGEVVDLSSALQVRKDSSATGPLSYSIQALANTDYGLFEMDLASPGKVNLVTAQNFESPLHPDGSYSLVVRVTDSLGSYFDQTLTFQLTNVLEPAQITPPPPTIVAENSLNNSWSLATDLEDAGAVYTWSLAASDDAAKFSINPNTGLLSFVHVADFEAPADVNSDNVYAVTVQLSNQSGQIDSRVMLVSISDVNEAPVVNTATTFFASENSVGQNWTIAASDPDTGDSLSWSINGGADQNHFIINSATGVLQFLPTANFEAPQDANADNVYEVLIEVSDTAGHKVSQAVTLSIANENEAPTITSSTAFSTAEGTASATFAIQAVDQDSGSTLLWSIVGGADSASFSINSATGALQLNHTPNFENPLDSDVNNTYNLIINVQDEAGLSDVQSIDIQITNQNEAPTLTSGNNFTVNENTAGLFQLSGLDPDAGSTLTYSIVGGADAGAFTLGATTGRLRFSGAAALAGQNFESAHGPSYTVVVRVQDQNGLTSANQTIRVNIANLNEPLSIAAPANISSSEDQVISFATASVHAIQLADQDLGQTYQLSLSASNGLFRANGSTSSSALITGSLLELRSYIETLQFVPSENFFGAGVINLQVTDDVTGSPIVRHTINLTITSEDDPLLVVHQTTPSMQAGNTLTLTTDHLSLQDNDTDTSGIVYTLSATPTAISLAKGSVALVAGSSFTQADIDTGLVQITTPLASLTSTVSIPLQARDSTSQAAPLELLLNVDVVSTAGPAVVTAPATLTPAASSPTSSAGTTAPTTSGTSTASSAPSSAPRTSADTAASGSTAALIETSVSVVETESTKAMRAAATGVSLKANNNAAPTVSSNAGALSSAMQLISNNNPALTLQEAERQVAQNAVSSTNLREISAAPRANSSDEDREFRREALRSVEFTRDIDSIRRDVQQELSLERAVVGSSVAVTTSVSIGYVIWLLRGGVLLSSLLATLPAWRSLDPFPVLSSSGGHDEPAEDDSLQGLLKRAAEKVKASAAAAEHQNKNAEETA